MIRELIERLLGIDHALVTFAAALADIGGEVRKCRRILDQATVQPRPCWNITHTACVITARAKVTGKTKVYGSIEQFNSNKAITLADYVRLKGRRVVLLGRLRAMGCDPGKIAVVEALYEGAHKAAHA